MMPTVLFALLVSLALALAHDPDPTRPLAIIREGALRGTTARSAAGNLFYSFKGIPYARAPEGELRFMPPQRHPGWHGEKDASQHGNRCMQYNFFTNYTKEGGEDCLSVNVYTPVAPQLKPTPGGLPVMVWVHGGGYVSGNGDDEYYGPHYFMDEHVVLVTFNYRLGPFGFFSTFDKNASGNYALLDQILALEWVQNNIASFGGDPCSATVFGESAGGALVSLLVLSPLSKGLFQHAISQSGAAVAHWGASGRRTTAGDKMAAMLNCTSEEDPKPTEEIVNCMRNATADDVLESYKTLGLENIHFYPRVDAESERPVMPEDPRAILETGTFNLVPWMMGVTQHEHAFFLPELLKLPGIKDAIEAKSLSALGLLAEITTPTESATLDEGANATEVMSELVNFYAENRSLSDNDYLPLVEMLSDRTFNVPMSVEAQLASAHTAVYKYVLDHTGPGRMSFLHAFGGDLNLGPAHGDDLNYLFKYSNDSFPSDDSPEYAMIRFMVGLWTSFARTGRPSSEAFATPDWPVFNENLQRHMRLNSEPSVAERLFEDRVQFWKTLPFNEPWKHAVRDEDSLADVSCGEGCENNADMVGW